MRMWFKNKADPKSKLDTASGAQESARDSKMHKVFSERGDVHLKLGELYEAERCYRLVLQSVPRDRNALVNLGFVLKELRRIPESVEFIERALDVSPDDADANYLRAALYQAVGNLAQAAFHFERAVTSRPQFEFAYRELVTALFQLGRIAEATHWCESALEKLPASGELHFYRSNLYKHAGASDAAITSARMALRLRPGLLAARSSLEQLLSKALQQSTGSDCTAQDVREIAAGYADLGLAYLSFSEFTAAQDAFERALALAPQVADYHYNLGTVLRFHENVAGAVASFDRAISLDADHAPARWAKSLVHAAPFPGSIAAAAHARIEILAGLEEFSLWSAGRPLQGEQFVGFSAPFYLSYQEHDNRSVFERYGALCVRAMEYRSAGTLSALPSVAISNTARIRIGVVSADIREHSVWFSVIKGWLQHLDRKRFEIGIFSLTSSSDGETEWAKLHSDFFISGPKSVQQWMESIASLDPAVLIYPAIGLDSTTLQLASLRLAPTQITTWGHPETSGLPTIDLYFSGESFEPANAQQFYSEKLVTLINLGNCYAGRVEQMVEPDLESLNIDATKPILICSGTAFKYQVEHDRVLTQIARRIDGSQLIFFRQSPHSVSDLLKARLERTFAEAGIDFERHVRFIPAQPLQTFHGLLRRANVALDTIGFSGYNTAIQAIESGVPLITREGRFLRGRLASGILRRLGITELIAQTTDEYVSLAAKVVEDSDLQRRLRIAIGDRRAILYNDVASIRHLENVLEEHVRR